MAQKREITERELDLYRTEQFYLTIRTGVRTVGWVGAAAFVAVGAIHIAGSTTNFDLRLSILGDLKFSLMVALTGSTTVWAVLERRLRQQTVERLAGRNKELELRVDPRRSTSGLTTKGKTHPRDKK